MKDNKQFKNRGSRKPRNRRDRKVDVVRDETTSKSATNDVSWYTHNPNLIRDTANISFGTIQGHDINVNNQNFTSNVSEEAKAKLISPGIMVLDYVHGPGYTTSQFDAVNIAALDIMSRIRKMQTGYSSYDPNDLMMYFLACNEVYMIHAMLVRLYGTLRLYNVESNYVPQKLVEALGFDFGDAIKHMPDYRALIEIIAVRMAKFAVPSWLDFMVRQYWMNSGIYADSTTLKHQLYAFRPTGYRQYKFKTDLSGSKLEFKTYPYVDGKLMKYDDIYDIAMILTDTLAQDADIAIMSGAVRTAVGENVWQLPSVDPDFILLASHDYNVLAQIENATIMGRPKLSDGKPDLTQFDIYTTNELGASNIVYSPIFEAAYSTVTEKKLDPRCADRLLNAHTMETGPEFVVEATRLTTVSVPVDGGVAPLVAGSEMIVCTHIYRGDDVINIGWTHEEGVLSLIYPFLTIDQNTPLTQVYAILETVRMMYAFDWAPQIQLINTTTGYESSNPLVDLDRYTVMSASELNSLHYAVLLSLFDVRNSN